CTTVNITKYYSKHKPVLDSIEQTYKTQYRKQKFSLLFTDNKYKHLSLELLTDSIRYIYDFEIQETRLNDTLEKYHLDLSSMKLLIGNMQSVHCKWIDNLDYYVDEKKNYLVYMSMRKKTLRLPFVEPKYYVLSYFSQPQYYDSEGRLLDHRSRKRLRKINNEIFYRVNDKVCYTVSTLFR
ncbi:MAG: hypothetical protein JST96_13570, partial [Bacteroidetes bacterium]|nr:hypothetical protein [Bacteroidota bacterium]